MTPPWEAAASRVSSLPVNPRVLSRLLQAADNPTVPTADLVKLVLSDAGTSLRVLTATPAEARKPVLAQHFSMAACIDALGREVLLAICFKEAARQLGGGLPRGLEPVLAQFWRRSFLCGETAAGLARVAGHPPESFQLAGLLCHLAALAEVVLRDPGSVSQTEHGLTADVEPDAGAEQTPKVMEWLNPAYLPEFMIDAVLMYREPPQTLADTPFLVRATSLAAALTNREANEETLRAREALLGIDAQTVQRVLEDARQATRQDPAHADKQAWVAPEGPVSADSLGVGSLALPDSPATGAIGLQWAELGRAMGEAGARSAARHALSVAEREQDVLLQLRRLYRLLTGFDRHVFFLLNPDKQNLVGTPVSDDTPHLAKVSVALESSPSLVALAARENRPVHAFDLAEGSGGAGIDRVLARMLGSTGLLCVPMSGARGVYGVTVAGLSLPQTPGLQDQVALLLSLNSAATSTVESVVGSRQLLERARNELIAQFQAAGRRLVHEAGNPLSIVKNYLRLLGNRLGPSGEFAEELTVLNEELDRVGRIVQRMRDPLAADSEESGPLDLNALVREALRLYGEALFAGRGIEVHHQLDPGIPALSADARSFKQVLLNLLTNAAEAMPNGGRLSLATADNVNLEGEIYVSLQVSDTGAGIPPEVMQRLFQPGTSTKGEGHEGIGLAVSAAIVKRHGGRILCRSTLGRGTIFLLLLPRRPVERHTAAGGQ